jgi:serine/threonine protein kinase
VALGTAADSLSAEPWTPPAPSELATAFPQLAIIELIGRGGMGAVYKARQRSLGRFVALKILNPEHASNLSFAERFSREAQALAELNHPNIVTVHDFGQAGAFWFLLMEYVDGANLRQAMKAGQFTPEQALAVVPPICEALQFAHDHGIVHRDIKPENLLLDKTGRVKIADFGIARMMGVGLDPASALTSPNASGLTQESVLGTPRYMAPEQSSQPARVDHRADIYSLGVVLYELLTGELPVGEFDPPSRKVHIDVRLDAIVLRALEQTPELRYQTIGEMRTEVETVVNESSPARARQHADTPPPRPINVGTSIVTTPEQLGTFEGQFFLYRHKTQMFLDDCHLSFVRAGTATVIPLAAIRDLSIGHYPRVMNPAGLDFISVTYDEGGQTNRLFFSPFQGLFALPSHYNQYVAEWFDAIRAAVKTASGRAPGNTPANQLGTPSGSLALIILMWSPSYVLAVTVVSLLGRLDAIWIRIAGITYVLSAASLVLGSILFGRRINRKLPSMRQVILLIFVIFMGGAPFVAVYFLLDRMTRPPPSPAVPPPRIMVAPPRSLPVRPPLEIPAKPSNMGIKQ